MPFNPSSLRKAKIVYNFGLSECNRANRIEVPEVDSVIFLKLQTASCVTKSLDKQC